MSLHTITRKLQKVALGLALTGATLFQANGCTMNIPVNDLSTLLENTLSNVDLGGGSSDCNCDFYSDEELYSPSYSDDFWMF
ncbi:MAG: hypothetical protein AMXMBFR13_04390 [Phycisphaerae bacterium]